MVDMNYAPVCGIYCGNCPFLGQKCKGCGYLDGKPFWTSQLPSGVCPLHDCCRNKKGFEHCGQCDEFPCKAFLDLRDPDMSDEEFRKSLEQRKNALKRRTEVGTKEWLQEVSDS